jgi:hypothetical protein
MKTSRKTTLRITLLLHTPAQSPKLLVTGLDRVRSVIVWVVKVDVHTCKAKKQLSRHNYNHTSITPASTSPQPLKHPATAQLGCG